MGKMGEMEMEMAKHTQGKLTLEDRRGGVLDASGGRFLIDGVALPTGNHPRDAEARANAARLVLMWNTFDELLAALRRWTEADGGAGLHLETCAYGAGGPCDCGLDDAREPVAAVTGAEGA